MLLAFDTGNTNVVMGVYEGDRLFASWRFATDARRTADEYAVLCRDFFATKGLGFEAIDQIIISSVVPDLTRTLVRMCEVYFGRRAAVGGSWRQDRLEDPLRKSQGARR